MPAGTSLTIHFLREVSLSLLRRFLCRFSRLQGVIQLFHPIMWTHRKILTRHQQSYVKGLKGAEKSSRNTFSTPSLCNRYRYEISVRIWGLRSSLSPPGESTLYWQKHESNQTASHTYLLCTTEWNQFMLFNPHYDVVVVQNTKQPKWISRSLTRV